MAGLVWAACEIPLDRIRRGVTRGKETKICYVWESERKEHVNRKLEKTENENGNRIDKSRRLLPGGFSSSGVNFKEGQDFRWLLSYALFVKKA